MQDNAVKTLLTTHGIAMRELGVRLGVSHVAISLVASGKAMPRAATVTRWLTGINAILADRGSDRRVSYDELWAAFCVGRLPPLPAVDHSTTAPSAQGA
jgi:transcriptional regulator with XRE-family HTH domain